MYIRMSDARDFKTWLQVAKVTGGFGPLMSLITLSNFVFQCFKIWDLDARGFHRGLWRLHMRGNQLLVVGSPASPYA